MAFSLIRRQTYALVWKSWILRIRHPILTLLECFLPLFMLVSFSLIIARLGQPDPNSQYAYIGQRTKAQFFNNPQTLMSSTLHLYSFQSANLLYAPDNVCAENFVKNMKLAFQLRTGSFSDQLKLKKTHNDSELIHQLYTVTNQKNGVNTMAIGLPYNECKDNEWDEKVIAQMLPHLFIRLNMKNEAFIKKTYVGPFPWNRYGFPQNPYNQMIMLLNDARMISALKQRINRNLKSIIDMQITIDKLSHSPQINESLDLLRNVNIINDQLKLRISRYYKLNNSNDSIYTLLELLVLETFFPLNFNNQSVLDSVKMNNDFAANFDISLNIAKLLELKKLDTVQLLNQLIPWKMNPEIISDFQDFKIFDNLETALKTLDSLTKDDWVKIIESTTNPENPIPRIPLPLSEIELNRFIYPAYEERAPPIINESLSYVIVFGFIVSFPLMIWRILEEKHCGLIQMFKLIGLRDISFFLSLLISYAPIMLFHSASLAVLLKVNLIGKSAIFYNADISLLFVSFFIYEITSAFFIMTLSVFFQRPIVGMIASVISHIVLTLPDYFLEPALVGNSANICMWRAVSCLLPNMALNYIIRIISARELYNHKQTWENLFEQSYQYPGLSVGLILSMCLFSGIFYALLWAYLDRVWPWQAGVPQHPFFFLSNFWWTSNKKKKTKSPIKPLLTGESNAYFEPELANQRFAVRVRDLRKDFGTGPNRRLALNHLNLDLPCEQLCVLLGHNGAGKSTLMSMITGLQMPTYGLVQVDGHDMYQDTQLARSSISYCPQYNALYDDLSALEHLRLFKMLRGVNECANGYSNDKGECKEKCVCSSKYSTDERLLEELSLSNKAHCLAGTYSGGQKRKLCLAIALLGDPRLVVLDEPTSGMDPESRRCVIDVLLKHRRKRAILLTTHFLEEADVMADKICILSAGKVRCYGSPSFLRQTLGAGYKLRFAKSSNFANSHRDELFKLLHSHFPRGECVQESVGELIYALEASQRITNNIEQWNWVMSSSREPPERKQLQSRPENKLARFFTELEELKSQLQLNSCGISVTTLEDMFLRVLTMDSPLGEMDDDSTSVQTERSDVSFSTNTERSQGSHSLDNQNNQDGTIDLQKNQVHFSSSRKHYIIPQNSTKRWKPKNSDRVLDSEPNTNIKLTSFQRRSSEINSSSHPISKPPFVLLQGWSLLRARFYALFAKRVNFAKRYKVMILFQWLVPFLFFMALFQMDGFLKRKILECQAFELSSSDLYGPTIGFLQLSEQVKNNFNSEKLIDSFNQTFTREKIELTQIPSNIHVQQYLVELSENIPSDEFFTKHLYGFSLYMVNEKRPDLLQDNVDPDKMSTSSLNALSNKSIFDNLFNDIKKDVLNKFSNKSVTSGSSNENIPKRIEIMQKLINSSMQASLYAQIWYNNEALQSSPIGLQILYESLFRYFDLQTSDKQPYLMNTINRPMRSHFEYAYLMQFGHLFKILWGTFLSIAFSFQCSSFVLQPSAENISRCKLLQLMSGLQVWIYWLANALFDLLFYILSCVSLIALMWWQDEQGVFFDHPLSVVALFIIFIAFGICMIPICYCVSMYAKSTSNAFVTLIIINLVSGIFLTLMDYVLENLKYRNVLSIDTYSLLFTIFRLFPLFSLSKAVNNLNSLGGTANSCKSLSSDFLEQNCVSNGLPYSGCCKKICGDTCFTYENPFSWHQSGILRELLSLIGNIIFWYIVLFLLEEHHMRNILHNIWKAIRNSFTKKPRSSSIDANSTALDTMRRQLHRENSTRLDDDVWKEQVLVQEKLNQLHSVYTNRPFAKAYSSLEWNNYQEERVLLVENLCKSFDDKVAVDNVSFSVREQECFGLLGINGAGKTTTFRMLVGELQPSSGEAYVGRLPLSSRTDAFFQNIGYCPQFDPLIDLLTGEEMLYLFGRLRGVPENALPSQVDRVVQMVDLMRHASRLTQSYSGGTKRKLSVGIALIGQPKLLFLDEPTTGVDPKSRRRLWRSLDAIRKVNGLSLVLTSHSMEECEALCGRLAIMTAGQLRCLGSIQHLRNKFGVGFSLSLKLHSQFVHDDAYLARLQREIRNVLPSAAIVHIQQTVIEYHISDASLSFAFLFSTMDRLKKQFHLENYFIGDTTLEEIFIGFARQQQQDSGKHT